MVPFKISEESVKQLREVVARSPQASAEYAVRIYISGLSNNGPEWGLTLDQYAPEVDECCDFDGFRVIVERELLEAVGGLEVEYELFDDENGGFIITPLDPEVQSLYSSCGGGCCGGCGGCSGCGGCHDDDDENGCDCGCHDDDENDGGCCGGGCGCGHKH